MNQPEGDNEKFFPKKEHLSRADVFTIIIHVCLIVLAMIIYNVFIQIYGHEKFSDATKTSKAIFISSLIFAWIILMWGALGVGFRLNKSVPILFMTFVKKYVIIVIISIVIVSKFVIVPVVNLAVSFGLSVLR